MTDPRVAALAVDLGLQLGSDLVPRPRRREPLRWTADGAAQHPVVREAAVSPAGRHNANEISVPSVHAGEGSDPVPLVPVEEADDLVEFSPTSADWRKAQREAGWVALYIAGPGAPVPTVMQGMEYWPFCVGTTESPRDVKRLAQYWHWLDIKLHAVLWCDSKAEAKRLKELLEGALDHRLRHLSFRYYDWSPMEAEKLALELAGHHRIPVFDEGERQRRLQEAVAAAMKRISGR